MAKIRAPVLESVDTFLQRTGKTNRGKKMNRRSFNGKFSKREILSLAKQDNVAKVYILAPNSEPVVNHSATPHVVEIDSAWKWSTFSENIGSNASGIKVSVSEFGLHPDSVSTFQSCLSTVDNTITYGGNWFTSYSNYRWHNEATLEVLATLAKSVEIYNFDFNNDYSESWADSIVSNSIKINTLSAAWNGSGERWRQGKFTLGNGGQSYDSGFAVIEEDDEVIYADERAEYSPWPVLVHSTGNGTDSTFKYRSMYQMYNAIIVGAGFYYHDGPNQGDYIMTDLSPVHERNPSDTSNGGSCVSTNPPCDGERELPHLVVPCSAIYSNGNGTELQLQCAEDRGTGERPSSGFCSSSIASPMVGAMAARLIKRNSDFGYAEAAKAVLMMTGNVFDGNEWDDDEDSNVGAGAPDGSEVNYFLNYYTNTYGDGGPAVQFGFDNFDLNGYDRNYKIDVPGYLPSGTKLRAILVWNSCAETSVQSRHKYP